jgi:hypothetical protein
MWYVATMTGGLAQGTGNVEQVPPSMAPAPFGSNANLAQAQEKTCSEKVKILGQPVIVQGTGFPMTSGGPPPAHGVVSGTSMGPAKVVGDVCTKVRVEGKGVAVQLSTVGMNQNNVPMGKITSVAQRVVYCTKL